MNKKHVLILVPLLSVLLLLQSCSDGIKGQDDIIGVYRNNEEKFISAAETGDFTSLEDIRGVDFVSVTDDYICIEFYSSGFGSSTHYYGIFYSEDDNLTAVDVAPLGEKLIPDGNGYSYKQSDGDNEYYVEPLGNHYFYYEAHF